LGCVNLTTLRLRSVQARNIGFKDRKKGALLCFSLT